MADLPFSGLPLDPSINAAPLQSLYAPTPQIPTEIAPRGGMFGGNAQMALMAAISGLMARRHPQVSQMMQNMLLLKQKQALAQQQRQQGIADDFTKFKQQYDYELGHPKPINNDTANDYAFWQQHLTPEQFQQYVQKQYDPDVSIPLPDGRMYVGPRSGMAAALGQGGPPKAPVGKLTPLGAGGPTPSASGSFPY
jgi:hypothetical protein